jgi:uncharacterized protein YjiS (DUF1127 family)
LALKAQADYALQPRQHKGTIKRLAREVTLWEEQRRRELV